MEVLVYGIKPFEKEFREKDNQRREITLISNILNMEPLAFAKDRDAVIISTGDSTPAAVANTQAEIGTKRITPPYIPITNTRAERQTIVKTVNNGDFWQREKSGKSERRRMLL
jgi:hypothetical protein